MTASVPEQPARRIGRVNWLGLWTHYFKEVHRFWKVGFQTLVAPMVTTLLAGHCMMFYCNDRSSCAAIGHAFSDFLVALRGSAVR